MIQFRENRKKPYFWAILGPFWPKTGQKIFFRKIGLRHFLRSIVLHLHAKNQKISMNQSREKLVTDVRTYVRTYTGQFIGPNLCQVGPKKFSSWGIYLPNSECDYKVTATNPEFMVVRFWSSKSGTYHHHLVGPTVFNKERRRQLFIFKAHRPDPRWLPKTY